MYLFGASVAAAPRQYHGNGDRVIQKRAAYLPDMVVSVRGDLAAMVSWVITDDVPELATSPFRRASLAEVADLPFMGPAPVPTTLPAGKCILLLPHALPLPLAHGLLAGQVIDATQGPTAFPAALQADIPTNDPSLRDNLSWATQEPVLQAWLAAIAANTPVLSIPFLARASIASALDPTSPVHPSVSDDSLAPYSCVETALARRLHRDNIFATLKTSSASSFQTFEDFQLETVTSAHPPFGSPDIEGMAMMFYWRPPKAKSWLTRYSLDGFEVKSSVPPAAREFLVVPLRSKKPPGLVPMTASHR